MPPKRSRSVGGESTPAKSPSPKKGGKTPVASPSPAKAKSKTPTTDAEEIAQVRKGSIDLAKEMDVSVVRSPTRSPPKPRRSSAVMHTEVAEEQPSTTEGGFGAKVGTKALEDVVLRTKVIAPDISGISCVAVNRQETEVVVAREDGSLVLYALSFFQNIPHFTRLRHTGGRTQRTITRLQFVEDANGAETYLLSSYLSGQLVLYDAATLSPLYVHQRTGGAVWDFCCVLRSRIYAAMGDGSWHQLHLSASSSAAHGPQLSLQRIIPAITGADRALSVAASVPMGLVVGSDDAGNVHAWKLDDVAQDQSSTRSLAQHESRWTTRLQSGMALCVAVVGDRLEDTASVVAVGTSVGDVVLLHPSHGNVMSTFSQHRGPVSTITHDHGALFASGWHESLRSYRCTPEGEWYPAEVKRRTHYHEATQLLVLPQKQLMLSAARDGTLLYAPVAHVFTRPAMYVNVTTQQFAFAQEKNVLLHTRQDRIEAFRMDAAMRHWSPLFAHKISGTFHLRGLWCDPQLHYIVFCTDERVVLLRVCWRSGAEDALVISQMEELLELPVGRGVVDVHVDVHTSSSGGVAPEENSSRKKRKTEGVEATSNKQGEEARVYILLDDQLVFISATSTAAPVVVRTPLPTATTTQNPRYLQLHVRDGGATIYGLTGTWTLALNVDGTPDAQADVQQTDEVYRLVRSVECLAIADGQGDVTAERTLVGLSQRANQYHQGLGTKQVQQLPNSLPHDASFLASLPPETAVTGPVAGNKASRQLQSQPRYIATFSKGLLLATGGSQWKMACRASIEAAFVMQDRKHVLVLERNLEKALESLPLCWKVRRFGN